ncbi:MAG: hypothetical protein ABFS46_18795 [Myxococcota bacterium]
MAAWLAGLLALLWAPAGFAESALRLPTPDAFGSIPADTYDESGLRVGDALVRIEEQPDGLVELEARSGIEGAERTIVTARLDRPDGTETLRPLSQSSRSFDAGGNPLGVLTVDHVRGVVVCMPPSGEAERIELPPGDRVANVPLNLLFVPLVRGEAQEIDFQFVLCRGGARVLDATAHVAGRQTRGDEEVVEIRYSLDLGPLLSRLAAPFLPRLSVWLEGNRAASWVGHRMPLFSQGPTVVVMRSGVVPSSFGLTP